MTHTLTSPQQSYITNAIGVIRDRQRLVDEATERLNWFLSYVVDEAGLPKHEHGYSLSADGTQLIPNEPQQEKKPNA